MYKLILLFTSVPHNVNYVVCMGRLRMKKNLVSFIICLLILTFPFLIFAHSGRTDSSGGHRDNKNKSGLGSYHYHCGGNPPHLHTNGVCPYKGGTTAVSTSYSKVYAQKINAVNVPKKITREIRLDLRVRYTHRIQLMMTLRGQVMIHRLFLWIPVVI